MQMIFIQLFCLSLLVLPELSGAVPALRLDREPRLSHARELLGKSFARKVIRHENRKSNQEIEVSEFVVETTRVLLRKKHSKIAEKVGFAILNASEEYSLDPVFLMAVIQNESSFDPVMRGAIGEIGLMQILPSTGKWISEIAGIEYRGDETLFDPVMNVWIGAALMAKLRKQFDSESRLYVSAYNIGPKKLRRLIAMNRNPKLYVQAVMKRYLAFYSGYKAKGDLQLVSQKAHSKVLEITN